MLLSLQNLPAGGLLRVLIIASTLGLIAFGVTVALAARRGGWRDGLWAAAPLVVAGLTMAAASTSPWMHRGLALATMVLALRNLVTFRGAPRVGTLVGLSAWASGIVSALMLFGR